MHKTQIQFSAGDCVTFGEEGEDEVPLTQAPGLQSEVAFQGGRRQARTQQRRHRSRSAAQRLSEGRALSALRRRLRNARTAGAKFWPTLWFAQMSAIVVTLVVAALVAFTFVLREAQLTAKEAQNAGRALDIDDIGNGTNITAALFGDGAADLVNSSLQEWSAAVVRGSAGSPFTGQSSTHDGVPHLKERGVERHSPKHFPKTVRGAESKEKKHLRSSSLRPGNKVNRQHPQGDASQMHSI